MENYKRKNRISEALAIRGMKQVDLCERTGIGKSSVNGWIKQHWQPKQEALYKMSKVLDVSELWLAGYDVPMERPLEQKKADSLATTVLKIQQNERYYDLISDILELSDDQLVLIESLVKQLRGLVEE